MKLEIKYISVKNKIALIFDENLPSNFAKFLRELRIKRSVKNHLVWHADNRLSYQIFTESLSKHINSGKSWKQMDIGTFPTFLPTSVNITERYFRIVTVFFEKDGIRQKEDYLIFALHKESIQTIADEFAIKKFKEAFLKADISDKQDIRKARNLLSENNVIPTRGISAYKAEPTSEFDKQSQQQESLNFEETEEKEALNVAESKNEFDEDLFSTELRHEVSVAIAALLDIEDNMRENNDSIISRMIMELEQIQDQENENKFEKEVKRIIRLFRIWIDDLEVDIRDKTIKIINRLLTITKGTPITEEHTSLSIAKDLVFKGRTIQNVIVPLIYVKSLPYLERISREVVKTAFPNLYEIRSQNIQDVSIEELFQLLQLVYPTQYGIDIERSDVIYELNRKGAEGLKKLGLPTDLDYPYVSTISGYSNVRSLSKLIGANHNNFFWWGAMQNRLPIADLAKGINIIDDLLSEKFSERIEFVNPRTQRPKTSKEAQIAYYKITAEIQELQTSKQVIVAYLNKQLPEESQAEPSKEKEDYIDRVIAEMNLAYLNHTRLSKKKIEALQEKTGAPTLGALWEAVELSWLLWYKKLYQLPISFEDRLSKMVHFWNKLQPTYQYSDSSKELYKQYSTPCPIGAIIAQYTGMDYAEAIFEPSAGNGLLLVGAAPQITHVNEIDKSRVKSLEFQQFKKITTKNAALPFDKKMNGKFDVMVTNPPFAKWEEEKKDKGFIIREYFHNHVGLRHHIRLEHLMAGLALRTIKDNGKAAIIIMGHVYYGADGRFKKYRPFFNWLYRQYHVDDVINMNSYKLYNKQGAVTETMLILIGGRKAKASGAAPTRSEQPDIGKVVESFEALWERVQYHISPRDIDTIIQQLKIAKRK